MDDRRKTLVAITIILSFLLVIAIAIGITVSRKKILSPVPEESGIRIIFITPTPSLIASPTPTIKPR